MQMGAAMTGAKEGKSYEPWLGDLKRRYLTARLRAANAVNTSLIEFYWGLGRDIEKMQYANTYGSDFFNRLSADLRRDIPDAKGLSVINIRYMHRFYCLYAPIVESGEQSAEQLENSILPQPVEELPNLNIPQPVEQLPSEKVLRGVEHLTLKELFSVPWAHHRYIIDRCKGDAKKAIFYVQKTLEYGWGRTTLLNFLDTDLYEREGKAITNFSTTLPELDSDLAQQLTKDPYNFDFLTLRAEYNERELEDALVANVTHFLLELGTGFSYMGRQFRLEVGEHEFFPDLLFYNARIHAYFVVELKADSFKPEYLGQLSFYVSAINHKFKTEVDNPTVGLLICKDKNSVVAHYSLESYTQPLGISEYQLSKLYPADFKSSLPTIEEIEASLSDVPFEDNQ